MANFKVKALFSSHNATNGAEIVVDPTLIASNSCVALLLYGWFEAPVITSLNSMQAGGVGSFEAPINLESNSKQTSTNVEPLTKKQCKNYDATRKWQDSWVVQFAWA